MFCGYLRSVLVIVCGCPAQSGHSESRRRRQHFCQELGTSISNTSCASSARTFFNTRHHSHSMRLGSPLALTAHQYCSSTWEMPGPSQEPPLSIATERNLYVVVPPSRLFAAHWSFFLPGEHQDGQLLPAAENHRGRRIHVSGDRLNGFDLEIIREYDASKHRSAAGRKYLIGVVTALHSEKDHEGENRTDTSYDRKDEDEGGGYIDNRPQDQFEAACFSVEAPGPSLRKVKETQGCTRSRLAEQKDC